MCSKAILPRPCPPPKAAPVAGGRPGADVAKLRSRRSGCQARARSRTRAFFCRIPSTLTEVDPEPTPAETKAAIESWSLSCRRSAGAPPASAELSDVARDLDSPAAVQARRLASVLAPLVKAPPAALDEARHALITPLKTTLRQVRSLPDRRTGEHRDASARAEEELDIRRRPGRVEVAPKGDDNDNAVLRRFVTAVRSVAPDAAGSRFSSSRPLQRGQGISQAGVLSVVAITLILFIALRRWIDVALTLVPLLVAIVVTLEICVLIGLQLNFANIIALPLLLGVGVAFKIYYIIAWRSGGDELPAIEPDACHPLQRLHHGHRFRQPVVLTSPGHIEHGQADGPVAADDPGGRCHLPAGSDGDATAEAPSRTAMNLLQTGPLAKSSGAAKK